MNADGSSPVRLTFTNQAEEVHDWKGQVLVTARDSILMETEKQMSQSFVLQKELGICFGQLPDSWRNNSALRQIESLRLIMMETVKLI